MTCAGVSRFLALSRAQECPHACDTKISHICCHYVELVAKMANTLLLLYCFQINLLEGSSLFIRMCDARRDDELPGDIPGNKLVRSCFVKYINKLERDSKVVSTN